MGSGNLIKTAIKKYGIENFSKEILFKFDNEADMNAKEAELVSEEFVKNDTNYNLCPGGNGGWGYINTNGLTYSGITETRKKATLKGLEVMNLPEKRKIKAANAKLGNKRVKELHPDGTFLGKKHSSKSKEMIGKANSLHQKGSNNSNYGNMWITNGNESRVIKRDHTIPEGWYKGRTISKK